MPKLLKILENTLFGSSSCKELFHKSRLNVTEEGYMPWYSGSIPFSNSNERNHTWTGNNTNPSLPSSFPMGLFPPPPLGAIPQQEVSYEKEAAGKRWNWEFDLENPNQVKNLTCQSESMGNMEMTVCDLIKWKDPQLTISGKMHTLPLTKQFLAEAFHTNQGTTDTFSKYWKVPTVIDKGMLLVFAFQYNPKSDSWEIIPDHLLKGDVMPVNDKKDVDTETEEVFVVSQNQTKELLYVPLKVIVCVELICCETAFNYEPLGILQAARFFPHLMIISNRKIDKLNSEIKLMRPENNGHSMDDMTGEIKSGFYSDLNNSYPFRAVWNEMFAYHYLEPQVGENFVVVNPLKKGTRTVKYAVMKADIPDWQDNTAVRKLLEDLSIASNELISPELIQQILNDKIAAWKNQNLPDLPTYKAIKFVKVPRQGEFDNVHIAPVMKVPDNIKEKLPDWKLDDIKMAPACVHDCFHMHWRWLNQLITNEIPDYALTLARLITDENSIYLKGWNDQDEPFSEIGAPMVAVNQKVSIRMESKTGFSYVVDVSKPILPGYWQIIMHHGAAYGVNDLPIKTKLMVKPETIQLHPLKYLNHIALEDLESWSMIYTCFRYGYLPEHYKKPFERILVTALDIARKA